ncbi:hypothetical protein GCM10010424_73270 [Streptomyces lienomycini]
MADVVGGDELHRPLGLHRQLHHALALGPGEVEQVVHEEHRPQDGGGNAERQDVLLDLGLGLEVVDAGAALGAVDRAVDEVRDAVLLGDVCDRRVSHLKRA